MARRPLAGTATVTLDGVSVNVAGTFRYRVGNKNRETLTGMSGIHGFKETFVPPYIEMAVRDHGGLDMDEIAGYTEITVVAQLANGKTIMGEGMWIVNTQEMDSQEATFTARFEGQSVIEY